jgi:hypothetical protein
MSQSASPTASSTLNVRTQHGSGTYIAGEALSFFAGNPSAGRLVKMIGFRDGAWYRGDVSQSGTWQFTVGESGGYSSYYLAPYDNAVCYLSRISGNLNTSNDLVVISKTGTQFFLQEGGQAIGAARCMAYDQR